MDRNENLAAADVCISGFSPESPWNIFHAAGLLARPAWMPSRPPKVDSGDVDPGLFPRAPNGRGKCAGEALQLRG
jgi:hypothetical protein